jgi:hypothetical protein
MGWMTSHRRIFTAKGAKGAKNFKKKERRKRIEPQRGGIIVER